VNNKIELLSLKYFIGYLKFTIAMKHLLNNYAELTLLLITLLANRYEKIHHYILLLNLLIIIVLIISQYKVLGVLLGIIFAILALNLLMETFLEAIQFNCIDNKLILLLLKRVMAFLVIFVLSLTLINKYLDKWTSTK
jgi:hypothetical protein